MTLEITDRTAFKSKFAALMASNVSLITAGIEPSRDLSEKMIDEFLNQFTIATPAPTASMVAGYIVVNNMTGYIPGDFKGRLYDSYAAAQSALTDWFNSHLQGKISAYKVEEVYYFG